jgi:hypothetical protein
MVQELQQKVKSRETEWRRTAQSITMVALSEYIKHERRGDYLVKNEKFVLAAREYELSLNAEQRVLGKDNPVVVSLVQKYATIQSFTFSKRPNKLLVPEEVEAVRRFDSFC